MAENKKPQLTLARPADRSLEAFKEFITKMAQRIAPGSKSVITDDEWVDLHRKFWENAGKDKTDAKPAE